MSGFYEESFPGPTWLHQGVILIRRGFTVFEKSF